MKIDFHPVVLLQGDRDPTELFDRDDLKNLEDKVDEALECSVNRELDAFDAFMGELSNEALVPAERAMVKTYLAWKLGVGKR